MNEPIDILRLKLKEVWDLLAIRAQNSADDYQERRQSIRHRMPVNAHIILGMDEVMSKPKFLTYPIDLSSGGVGLLHGKFEYNDTRCTVVIPTLEGDLIKHNAQIVRCHHNQKNVHDVGLKFDTPIQIEHYIENTGKDEVLSNLDLFENEHLVQTSQELMKAIKEKRPTQEIKQLIDKLFAISKDDRSKAA